MKKFFALCAYLTALPFLVSCQCGVQKQTEENRTVFTLEHFDGRYKTKLERLKKGEGTIYFSATLSEGEINVYYDLGLIWEKELLFSASAGEPIVGVGGYLEDSSVTVIIDAVSPATGEIILDFENEITQTD